MRNKVLLQIIYQNPLWQVGKAVFNLKIFVGKFSRRELLGFFYWGVSAKLVKRYGQVPKKKEKLAGFVG